MRTNNIYPIRKNKYLLIFSLLIITIPMMSKAQDPHFSQYFNSPLTVNPALTGKGVDDGRLLVNLRSQWWGSTGTVPYNTETISYEQRLAQGSNNHNNLSFGLMLLADQSNGGLLQNNYFTGSFAYNQALDGAGNSMLGAGLSVTYANRLLNPDMFQFQTQFGSMGFQRSIPSNDPVALQSNKYFDINAGAQYSLRMNDKLGWNIGVSMFHLTSPTEGVYSNNRYQIDPRYNVQAGMQFYFADHSELHVSGLYESQYGNSIYTLGAVYKIKVVSDALETVNLGIWNRFTDALYPYLALEGKKWVVGFSYDIVTSSVKTVYNSVSSVEFSLGGKFNGKKAAPSTVKYGMVNY